MSTAPYTLRRIPVQGKLLPRSERRASILRAASGAFAKTGFANTSMEDVAAACGVTKLIVYRHFETKEELYRSILQSVLNRIADVLAEGIAAGATRGLGARTQLTVAREDPDGYTLLWRHASREPMFADYVAEARELCVAVVRDLMHIETGDDVVDHWEADVLFTWLVEGTLAWLADGDPARDDVFLDRTTTGLRAVLDAWRSSALSSGRAGPGDG